ANIYVGGLITYNIVDAVLFSIRVIVLIFNFNDRICDVGELIAYIADLIRYLFTIQIEVIFHTHLPTGNESQAIDELLEIAKFKINLLSMNPKIYWTPLCPTHHKFVSSRKILGFKQ